MLQPKSTPTQTVSVRHQSHQSHIRIGRGNLNQEHSSKGTTHQRWVTSVAEAALLLRRRHLLFRPIYTGCALRTTPLRSRRLWVCQRRWSGTGLSRCTRASTSTGTPCGWSPMMTAAASYSPSPSMPTAPEGPSASSFPFSPALIYHRLALGSLVSSLVEHVEMASPWPVVRLFYLRVTILLSC